MPRIPLGFRYNPGRSKAASLESVVNLYVEPQDGPGKAPFVLYSAPMKTDFCTIGGAPRGQID